MAISALGVGSGLDLGALLDQMRAAENQRLVPLQNQQKSLTAQLSAWGTVKSSVSKLQTAAEKLQKANNISLNAVKSENTAFKATVDAKAASGNYRVEVKEVATADFKSASIGAGLTGTSGFIKVTDDQQEIKLGSLSIKLDGPKEGETERTYTLNEVRDLINNAEGSHVKAQVVNGSGGAHLALTSKETGQAARIGELSGTLGITFATGVDESFTAKFNTQKPENIGKDAQISINGIEVSSATNTFKNVLDGVSITVSAKTKENTPETLTISQDTSGLKDALKAYVDAYNEIQDTIKTQTKFVPGKIGQDLSSDNGALMGNNTVRTLQNQLRGQLSSAQDGDFRTLNQLGIRLGSDGKLSIDDKTLDKALADNADGVVKFFAGDGQKTGFATQSANQLKQLTSTTTGLFKTQEDSINSMKRRLDNNIERTTQSIENTIANMRSQFEQLDRMMSDMSSTSAYLAQQLGSLM